MSAASRPLSVSARRPSSEGYAIGNRGGETLPSGSPTAQRRHIGLDPGLVEKDQTAGRDTRLMIFPATPLASDVRTFLLGGQNRFF